MSDSPAPRPSHTSAPDPPFKLCGRFLGVYPLAPLVDPMDTHWSLSSTQWFTFQKKRGREAAIVYVVPGSQSQAVSTLAQRLFTLCAIRTMQLTKRARLSRSRQGDAEKEKRKRGERVYNMRRLKRASRPDSSASFSLPSSPC